MDAKQIEKELKNLGNDTPSLFGIMTPQHMVEHLTVTVKISYNRIKIPEFELSEKQKFQKSALLDSPMEFPVGVKAPGLKHEELMPLRSSNLEEAKQQLISSLVAYNSFFELDPNATTVHPRFGLLKYEVWQRFHPKHFKHKLKQCECWE